MKNNKKEAAAEIVNLKMFAGLWIIMVPEYGVRCMNIVEESVKGGLAQRKVLNHAFVSALKGLSLSYSRQGVSSATTTTIIVVPRLKKERPEDVASRLKQALKKVEGKKHALFHFAEIISPTQEMFPNLMNLEYSIGRVRNLPGGRQVPIEFKVKPGTPYFNLFLPRDGVGNFINLGEQKLCLKTMEIRPDLKEMLADIIAHDSHLTHNLGFISRRGMKILYDVSSSGPGAMNMMAEEMIMLITMIRELLKNRGFGTGKDKPTVYSNNLTNSGFVCCKYDKSLRSGDFRVVCSDVRVNCDYNHGNRRRVVLTFS